jgi:hypothetical protein
MMGMNATNELIALLDEALKQDDFIKLTLSKSKRKSDDLKRVIVKPVALKTGKKISFQYQYQRRDEVKNHEPEQSAALVKTMLEEQFLEANMFTIKEHIMLLTNNKGSSRLIISPLQETPKLDLLHDKQKTRLIDARKPHWFLLGLTDRSGNILPSMQHKFKQINKYIEILDPLIMQLGQENEIHIADMGAGKGYLTFALYEYLTHKNANKIFVTGVEQRQELAEKTQNIALKAGFDQLQFVTGNIDSFQAEKLDVLIALHACDTATDDAIATGIKAGAKLIVCAPCCHKQIRNEMKAPFDALPMLRFGILFERQAEIITDTLRALIMEKYGYKSQIQEFIDAGHTPKNLLLTGIKTEKHADIKGLNEKIENLKKQYGINEHYLEKALHGIKPAS